MKKFFKQVVIILSLMSNVFGAEASENRSKIKRMKNVSKNIVLKIPKIKISISDKHSMGDSEYSMVSFYHNNGDDFLLQTNYSKTLVFEINGKYAENGMYISLVNSKGVEVDPGLGMGIHSFCHPKDYSGLSEEAVCSVPVSIDSNDDLPPGNYKIIIDYEDGSSKIHKIKLITNTNVDKS